MDSQVMVKIWGCLGHSTIPTARSLSSPTQPSTQFISQLGAWLSHHSSSGSLLSDPIVHHSNNPQATYNLSAIQRLGSLVDNSNAKWRYHVAFGRTLSTTEAAPSSPITKSRCNTNCAVCQEQIGESDAYNVAVVKTLAYTHKSQAMALQGC
ncbi:hypothetical protein BJ742DRAFT_797813 [Cladochytrium replicatum]|nr:hypothetical protein BJ742DRAFT_797813 [Cladochytrium replicatum]